jgi:GTPase
MTADPSTSDHAAEPAEPGFRSGFVALCGRPNVGKSTLLNALLGEELAVASGLPQTTRERMLGIWTTDRFQAVLVDTPGIHRAKSALNKYMVEEALRGARGVDLILMLAEVPNLSGDAAANEWEPGPGAVEAVHLLAATGRPMILVLTKADLLAEQRTLLPIIAKWQAIHTFDAVVPVSALQTGPRRALESGKTGATGNLDALRAEVEAAMPEGPALFDPEQLSDRSTRWHAGELIRAELFERLGQELPYSCAVTITDYKELRERDRVDAVIHVERASQKGIVIGAKGRTVKAISIGARERIAGLTGRPCELFLEVRVTPRWTRDPGKLAELGYRSETDEGRPSPDLGADLAPDSGESEEISP